MLDGNLSAGTDNCRLVFGTKNSTPRDEVTSPLRASSERSTSNEHSVTSDSRSESESASGASQDGGPEQQHDQIVARVSSHALREERSYHICKNLTRSVDPEGNHIARPVDIVRLTSMQGDQGPMVVCIYEHPGPSYLSKVVDNGPAWYRARSSEGRHESFRQEFKPEETVPLMTFLDFAVGATECLEILHHGQRIVHGEIRGDAFHMNRETGQVKLINFGSGLRTFEHGLTSSGWSTLSKEIGAKTKLSYMSPEQTGRMPAEPDSRTDIYSLGILFWIMLTQQQPFEGETPMDIIQAVLGRRLPLVSSIRMDIPDVISKIIQKMTAKTIGDRYHSVSGLRHDLIEVRKLLGDGNSAVLKNWPIATKDVSSFFILPTVMIGRSHEHDEVVKVIDKVSKRHLLSQRQEAYSLSSGSSLSDGRQDINFDASASFEESSEAENNGSFDARTNSISLSNSGGNEMSQLSPFATHTGQGRSGGNSLHNSTESQASVRSAASNVKPWEKNVSSLGIDTRSVVESVNGGEVRSISDGVGSLTNKRNSQKFLRRGRCEVVSISGPAGLGKSCLVQSVQVEARRRGYFASAKFDQATKTPFGPVLKLLSSLFKQVFSESNTDTPFHNILKQFVRPAWPLLHKALDLPEFLLGAMRQRSSQSGQLSHSYNKSLRAEFKDRDPSLSSSHGSLYSMALGAQSSQDFLRAGTSTKSMRLMNTFLDVLRVFTQHKFICFCVDDLQFADDESLDLITQIVGSRMKMVIIVTVRPDEIRPERIKGKPHKPARLEVTVQWIILYLVQ